MLYLDQVCFEILSMSSVGDVQTSFNVLDLDTYISVESVWVVDLVVYIR